MPLANTPTNGLTTKYYLLLLIVNRGQEREHWLAELAKTSPERLLDYPYVSLAEGLREAI